jgi:hypothetical protein
MEGLRDDWSGQGQDIHVGWLPGTAADGALIRACSAQRLGRPGSASAKRRAERNRSETRPGLRDRARAVTMSALVVALVAGPGFEPG